MPSAEQLVAKAKEGAEFLLQILANQPNDHENYMPLATRVISYLEHSGIMTSSNQLQSRTWFIQALQRYATYDGDVDGSEDVARWCERQWNRLLQQNPENSTALTRLGQYWLFRAQPLLEQLYDAEATACGEHGSSYEQTASNATKRVLTAAVQEEMLSSQLEQLRSRPEYAEARRLLSNATSFLTRAIGMVPSSSRSYRPLLIEVNGSSIHAFGVRTGR
ncbi:MAG: hypothetical protein Q9227_003832 [Pyrenula ochraceoflavens]